MVKHILSKLALNSEWAAEMLWSTGQESNLVGILRRLPWECTIWAGASDGKPSAYNAGDLGSIPGLGRSPGEAKGNPLQYSCLKNPMDGGTWQTTVHGVAKSQTRLSDFTFISPQFFKTFTNSSEALKFPPVLLMP